MRSQSVRIAATGVRSSSAPVQSRSIATIVTSRGISRPISSQTVKISSVTGYGARIATGSIANVSDSTMRRDFAVSWHEPERPPLDPHLGGRGLVDAARLTRIDLIDEPMTESLHLAVQVPVRVGALDPDRRQVRPRRIPEADGEDWHACAADRGRVTARSPRSRRSARRRGRSA